MRKAIMMKMVISLFDDYKIAEQVVEDLVKNGFSDNDIHVTGSSAKGRHSTDFDHHKLGKHLGDEGVPDEEAGYYAEGVRRGGTLITVSAADEWADKAADIMRRYEVVDIDARVDHWRSQGWTGYDPDATAYTSEQTTTERKDYPAEKTATQRTADDQVSVPVTEEELKVGKRVVRSGGIRVHSRVTERPVEETVALREEHVSVERRPVNRPVSDAERAAAFKEGVIETEEFREEAVVSKEARVVEEVVVGKQATRHEEKVQDTVRRTDVEIEQLGDRNLSGASDTVDYTDDFRKHYETNYANRGDSFDNHRKAYEYGYSLNHDSRYQNKDWSTIESQIQNDWEGENPNTWNSFKDSVRYGWEKLKGNR
jgi:uncharacterized protein (TIGR02271 family)